MIGWFDNPWLIALLSAYYVWFSIPALLVAGWRFALRQASRREVLLFLSFAALVALEWFQLAFENDVPFSRRECRSLSRYFGAFGPVLWIWAAWALKSLWGSSGDRALRVRRIAAVGFPLWILFGCSIPFFTSLYEGGEAQDALMAGSRAGCVIQQTWKGPARRTAMTYNIGEYLTARLPAVFDTWCIAAWIVNGQSEGSNLYTYPYKADYFLLNSEGYRGEQKRYDLENYEPLCRIPGKSDRWMLLRRKEGK